MPLYDIIISYKLDFEQGFFKKIFFILVKATQKKKDASSASFFVGQELSCTSCCEALAAIYRLSIRGIERNLTVLAALSANSVEHFSRASCTVLSCVTASLASLGLVVESLLCVEFLLTGGEHEIIAAILALECLVLVHVSYLALKWMFFALRRIPTDAFDNNALP